MESIAHHFVGKVAQKAVVVRDGKVLLSLGKGDKNYDLPGGRLHAGEDPKVGLMRELEEELQLKVEVLDPINIESYIKPQTGEPHLYIAYRTRLLNMDTAFMIAADEIEEVRWVGKDDFKSLPIWDQDKRTIQVYFSQTDLG